MAMVYPFIISCSWYLYTCYPSFCFSLNIIIKSWLKTCVGIVITLLDLLRSHCMLWPNLPLRQYTYPLPDTRTHRHTHIYDKTQCTETIKTTATIPFRHHLHLKKLQKFVLRASACTCRGLILFYVATFYTFQQLSLVAMEISCCCTMAAGELWWCHGYFCDRGRILK